jgi:iron complex outermembrane receptor protein
MKRFIVGALCALPVATLAAEALDPIIISDNRSREITSPTPTSIQVIDRDEIAASGADDLSELLSGRAGIFVTDLYGDGSVANIDMRGFGDAANNHVLVTVDGRRLNPSSDNATLYLNSIDLDNVERVEIIQGSAAILYGNMAVGGLINIITREPGTRDWRASGALGSYRGRELRSTSSERLADGWGYRASVRLRDSDNYRDRNDTRLRNLALLIDRRFASGRAFVELEHFDEYQQTPGALFASELAVDRRQAAYAADYIDTTARQLRLGLEQALGDDWRLEGELGYRVDDREFVQSFRAFPGSLSTQQRDIITASPRLIGRLGSHTLTLGADWEGTDYQLQTAFGPQAVDQDIAAIYAQLVHSLNRHTDLTLGVRHARVSNDIDDGVSITPLDDDVTVGSIGISWRPQRYWRLFARAEQNYRFAKVDEHTNPVFGQPIGLNNPTGVSYELGAQYADQGTQASLVIYRLDMQDEIGFDASGFYNINLDDTRRHGLQLSLRGPLTRALFAGISGDLTDGEMSSGPYLGSRIPSVPRYQARAFIEWAGGSYGDLYLEALHVGDRVLGADFANAYPQLGDYTVVNVNLAHQRGPWELTARINNVLDREYIASGALGYDASFNVTPGFNPAPERNLWLTASYQF